MKIKIGFSPATLIFFVSCLSLTNLCAATYSNQWDLWNYETTAAAPVTHSQSGQLETQFESHTPGYRIGDYAQYRLDLPSDLQASSLAFTASFKTSPKVSVYLAADSINN